jgi:hypothetical protein
MIIRNAEPTDFPEIISLINEFSVFQKTPEKVTITLEQLITTKTFLIPLLRKQVIRKSRASQRIFIHTIHGPAKGCI